MKKTIKNAVACLTGFIFILLLVGIAGAIVSDCAFPWGAAILCSVCGIISRLLW